MNKNVIFLIIAFIAILSIVSVLLLKPDAVVQEPRNQVTQKVAKTPAPIITEVTTNGFITEELLLKNNFKKDATYNDYKLENIKLSVVMTVLGFEIKDMHPTISQSINSDIRWVKFKNIGCLIESKTYDKDHRIIDGSLDDPNSICDVSITLYTEADLLAIAKAEKNYPKSGSDPILTVISVSQSLKAKEILLVEFTLEPNGDKPVALAHDQLSVRLFNLKEHSEPYRFVSNIKFLTDIPNPIVVKQGEKIQLTTEVIADSQDSRQTWLGLPKGKYILKVYVNSGKTMKFDYQWLGQTYSKEWPLEFPLQSK